MMCRCFGISKYFTNHQLGARYPVKDKQQRTAQIILQIAEGNSLVIGGLGCVINMMQGYFQQSIIESIIII